MIWTRDETRPTVYNGVAFRSASEAKVAHELDNLHVPWQYERPAERTVLFPDGTVLGYLPDFTLGPCSRDHELELTVWLEVKPSELLYVVRDHLGCPERLEGSFFAEASAKELQAAGLEEIWKPKRLAELSGLGVLVVNRINRNRTLSALMTPTGVELSKSHPLVNYRQVVRNRERDEQATRQRAEMERRQAAYEEQRRLWQRLVVDLACRQNRPARFDGWCAVCQQQQPAANLVIVQVEGRWTPLCRTHLEASERGADG